MIPSPFHLQSWIEEHLPISRGAIGNREVFKGSDFIFQMIKGPNARNDFHIDPWDEIFYQFAGHIFVHVMEGEKEHRIRIEEGQLFLLPKNIYHSPRRPPGSVGLVIERPRLQNELDGIAWFCENCGSKLHEVTFWCDDIEKTLREVVQAFNDDATKRSCGKCGSVLPDPRTVDYWGTGALRQANDRH